MKEIWKEVKNFENLYEVSNFGNVRSVERIIKTKKGKNQRWQSKQIKGYDNGNGYLIVSLQKNGARHTRYIHRLVAESFIGEIGDKDVNHKDFDRKNNRLNNLEILTRKENIDYSQKAGKYKDLYENRITKVKNKYNLLIDEINKDIKSGIPIYKIEKKYNVNHKTLKKYGYI